jgi:High-affinity nickel-transport protein
VIGTIELGGLVASQLGLSGVFWTWFEHIDINLLGFAIVAMFVATWVITLAIWRLGRIEERWSAHLENSRAANPDTGPDVRGDGAGAGGSPHSHRAGDGQYRPGPPPRPHPWKFQLSCSASPMMMPSGPRRKQSR